MAGPSTSCFHPENKSRLCLRHPGEKEAKCRRITMARPLCHPISALDITRAGYSYVLAIQSSSRAARSPPLLCIKDLRLGRDYSFHHLKAAPARPALAVATGTCPLYFHLSYHLRHPALFPPMAAAGRERGWVKVSDGELVRYRRVKKKKRNNKLGSGNMPIHKGSLPRSRCTHHAGSHLLISGKILVGISEGPVRHGQSKE